MVDTGLFLSAARSFRVPTQRMGTRKLSMTDDQLTRKLCLTDDQLERQLGIQDLPGNQKSRQDVGDPRGRQDVIGCGDAGTAVFQTAYGANDQLSATVRADAFWAAPDNAGQPAGLIPCIRNGGHRPDALRGAELPRSHAPRGNEKNRVGRHLLRHPPAGRALAPSAAKGPGRGDPKRNRERSLNSPTLPLKNLPPPSFQATPSQ